MNINFVYSAWWLLPGILAAGGLSYFLYHKDKQLRDAPLWGIRGLAGLRFLFLSGLIFLLPGPSLNIKKTEKEAPVFIIAQDNSSSVLLNADSAWYKNDYPTALRDLKSALEENFDLHYLQFGDSVSEKSDPDFTDGLSNFSDLHFSLEAGYAGRHVAGMLLATDGLYNEGRQPLPLFGDFRFPVFTLALSDTSQKRDALIHDLKYNRLAFLNNRFPLRIYYRANKMDDEELTIKLIQEGEVLLSKEVSVSGDKHTAYTDIKIEAKEAGLQTYEVVIEPVEGEISLENNRQLISVNVIDNQQEILILASAPHPDIAAMNRALEQNKNFSVSTVMLDGLPVSLEETDLIVYHQVPAKRKAASAVISQADKRGIPGLYILGPQSDLQAFNSLAHNLRVDIKGESMDNAQPEAVKDFNRFRLSADFLDLSDRMPPLHVPFADYRFSGDYDMIFTQRINGVETGKPLIALSGEEQRKLAYITGTGFWRWRMTEYIQNGTHDGFDDLFNNLTQYLITKSTGKQFAVQAEQIIAENKSVVFEAELYNQAYELINEPDVKLFLSDSTEETREFNFNRSLNAYRLSLGSLPAGEYTWKAEVNYENNLYSEEGNFIVEPVSMEGLQTQANHRMLKMISEATNAEMFYPDEMPDIPENLKSRDMAKPRITSGISQSVLLNLKWIFFLLLGLISLEWFFRKFWGGY
ncbi:MAG: hypothetical protein R6V52_07930 [Bacteroidales bacterium]